MPTSPRKPRLFEAKAAKLEARELSRLGPRRFSAILRYVADQSGNFAVAEAFVRRLRAQCHRLAGLESTIGRARPELRPDIRSFPYRGYVIFFRYLNGRFEVVNILEGHRDVEAHFHSDSE
jgi:plasmid stabilization system protein ParE